MFTQHFHITRAAEDSALAVGPAVGGFELPPPGAYNDGLISVLGPEGGDILQSWSWLLKGRTRPLVATGFGDLFFWSENAESVFFLDAQDGSAEFVDSDPRWLVDEFLAMPEIQLHVLRKPRFEELVVHHGPLGYCEAFILEPWPILGGEDRIENYTKGKTEVYLDLVGQALRQVKANL